MEAEAHALTMRGKAAIQNGVTLAREVLAQTSDRTAQYVHDQPLKSLLWAAAAGAGIALLASALSKHHGGHR